MIQGMRDRLVTPLLLVVPLILAACANAPNAGSGDARTAVLDAFRRTADAGSAHATFELTADLQGRTIDISGTAEYQMDPSDPTSLRERVVLQIPPLTLGMTGGEVEVRVTDGPVLYVKAPMLETYLHVPTPWLKIDPSESGDGGSTGMGSMAGLADPSALLNMLDGAISAEQVGTDRIDGAEATHYQVTVDVARAMSSFVGLMPAAERQRIGPQLPTALAKLRSSGLDRIPFDVWVDADGYVKRTQVSIDLSGLAPQGQTQGGAPTLSMTFTFSDVGAPVEVEPPPADQVTDAADLTPSSASTSSMASSP